MGRGTRTASLEENLIQQIMVMRKEVLYEIFLDIHKAYDALDRNHCLDILAAYRVIPRAIRLLRRYQDRLMMVARYIGYYSAPFKGFCWVNQGAPLSPTIFNMFVDAFLCHWVNVLAASEEPVPPGASSTEGFWRDV